MIQFSQLPIDETQSLVRRFTSGKMKYNNYFMNDLTDMACFHTEDSLLLSKNYGNYNRLYFISNNKNELISFLLELSESYAINIPTKRELDSDVLDVLGKSGYSLLSSYERLYKNTNEGRGDFEDAFAEESDVDTIEILLIEQLFHPVSDRIPSRQEIAQMVANKQALVNRDDSGVVNGVLLFSIENKKCNFLEWASKASVGESLFLYLNAFNMMAEKGIERSTIWVRSDNVRPKKIYLSWGYQPDGLRDYTFLKNIDK